MTPHETSELQTEARRRHSLHRRVRRDGVWTENGLAADFRHLYEHPNCDGIHRVQTASGEHYAHESKLAWDCPPNDKVSDGGPLTHESTRSAHPPFAAPNC
jgi:hypothetical protein